MDCGWSVGGFWLDCGCVWMVCGWFVDGLWMVCGWIVDSLWMDYGRLGMVCGWIVEGWSVASWGVGHHRICRVSYARRNSLIFIFWFDGK